MANEISATPGAATVTAPPPATPPTATPPGAAPPAGALPGAPPAASGATAAAAAPATAKPEDQKVTPRFAELARREKADVLRRAELKKDEAEHKAFREARELLDKDPLAAMEKFGVSFDKIIQAGLKGTQPPKVETLEEKVERLDNELKAEKEAEAKATQEAADAATRAQVNEQRAFVKDFVTKAGDAYELVNANDAHHEVFDVAFAHWEATGGMNGGEFMPLEQAAQLVEDYLFEEASKAVKGSKKLAQLLVAPPAEAAPAAAAKPTPPAAPAPGRPPAPTLSQSSTGGFVPPVSKPPVGASHEDVLARVMGRHAPGART